MAVSPFPRSFGLWSIMAKGGRRHNGHGNINGATIKGYGKKGQRSKSDIRKAVTDKGIALEHQYHSQQRRAYGYDRSDNEGHGSQKGWESADKNSLMPAPPDDDKNAMLRHFRQILFSD